MQMKLEKHLGELFRHHLSKQVMLSHQHMFLQIPLIKVTKHTRFGQVLHNVDLIVIRVVG